MNTDTNDSQTKRPQSPTGTPHILTPASRRRLFLTRQQHSRPRPQPPSPPQFHSHQSPPIQIDSYEHRKQLLLESETKLLQELSNKPALRNLHERRYGIKDNSRLNPYWNPPKCVTNTVSNSRRNHYKIHFTTLQNNSNISQDLPPFCVSFHEMKLPVSLINTLSSEFKIQYPTKVQMQAIPAAFSSRDVLTIASTGGGKTLSFLIPALLVSLSLISKIPVNPNNFHDFPFFLILSPSRELAKQTHAIYSSLASHFSQKNPFPAGFYQSSTRDISNNPLKCGLLTGGDGSIYAQCERELSGGVCGVIGTPGRIVDCIQRKLLSLNSCRLLILDEVDRLLDVKFESEMRLILDAFQNPKQILMFSATMAKSIQLFAENALRDDTLILYADKAGIANALVTQKVIGIDYLRGFIQSGSDRLEDVVMKEILKGLERSAPPCLVFGENGKVVDLIVLGLLEAGVRAVGLHGGKEQMERDESVKRFRDGKVEVLVCSDVAAKGMDFERVRNVISVGLPKETENYVHRVGRTGRNGRRGVCTLIVLKNGMRKEVVGDLVGLLKASKQKIPGWLLEMSGEEDETGDGEDAFVGVEVGGIVGCAYCGGLGHRIGKCTRLKMDVEMIEKDKLGKSADQLNADRSNTRGYAGDW